jgi:hypothetical protein
MLDGDPIVGCQSHASRGTVEVIIVVTTFTSRPHLFLEDSSLVDDDLRIF